MRPLRPGLLAVVLALQLCACRKGTKSSPLRDLVTTGFEGQIEVESHYRGATARSSFKIKGQKMRMDVPSGPMIADGGAQKVYYLDDTAKTYTVVDLKPSVDAGAGPVLKRTGKKGVVAGYACDEYESTGAAGEVSEFCKTTEIYGPLALAAGAHGALGGADGMSLRSVTRDAKGAELFRAEATRIDKRPIPESDVSIPHGYTEEH
jgi:hypothetical protein